MINRTALSLAAGEDRTYALKARTAANAVLNLTGATLTWRLKDGNGGLVREVPCTITTAALGLYSVVLSDANTELPAGDYSHETFASIAGQVTICNAGILRVAGIIGRTPQILPGAVVLEADDEVIAPAQMFSSRAAVAASSVASVVLCFFTAGYYTAGDGGGGLYKRVASAPAHAGYVQSLDGAYWELSPWQDNEINIKQFGAVGDGVADDTTAIANSFAYLKVKVFETTETEPSYFIRRPYGKFRTTGPINGTGIRNRVWGFTGPGVIYADFNGGVVLDLTFSRFPHLSDLHIETASGKVPAIGILYGRESVGYVADDHEWDNVHVIGTFSLACTFNYGSEDFAGENCSFINNASLASYPNAFCSIHDGYNRLGAVSTFQTIPANTAVSFNNVTWRGSNWRRTNGGPCLYVSRSDGHKYDDCYWATTSGPAIVFYTTAAIFNRGAKFDGHIETTGLTACFRFDGDAAQTLVGLQYRDFNPFPSDEIFLAGAGVTSVTLVYPKIEIDSIANGVNPTNGIFSPASAFKFKKPEIKVYNNGASVLELWDGITLASAAPNAAHTGDTAETTLATVAIYPNIMGTDGVLEIDSFWQFSASANAKTMRARLGASGAGLTGDVWLATANSDGASKSLHDRRLIANSGATNAQVGQNGAATGGWGTTTQDAATAARDTTAAMDLAFTGQCANAADTVMLKRYTVKLHLP